MIFEPDVVYPQDRIGRYVYLDGTITAVDAFLPDLASIKVQTKHGIITGYVEFYRSLPEIGWYARVKYYDWGGGYYPDPVITGWRKDNPQPTDVVPLPLPG